ncbi:MAG TPA: TetR family transcriptional regulator [Lactobacillus sp.]|nr:TetR family transcriptional regulator [Lactobacillus sp.]
MKIDVTKHLTLGAKRTLKAFRVAMFDALSEKDFDRITVNDICKKSEYPRATFYNYFDDKLDLLEYLWSYIGKNILDQISSTQHNKNNLVKIFNLLVDFFEENPALLANIKKSDGSNSHLWHNMSSYLKHEANIIVYKNYADKNSVALPAPLVSRFYSDLIIGLLEWYLFEEPNADKETADKYLITLLTGNF